MPDILDMGMDVRQIVDELMKMQRGPVNRLVEKKNDYHLKQTAYNNLESLLSKFSNSLDKLKTLFNTNSYSVTSSDESIVSAATTGALISQGEHTITVTQCASANQVTSQTFNSNTTALGLSGTLTITIGANTSSITVLETDTLEDIRDRFNNASDNVGTTASILSTTGPGGEAEYSLMLSSNNTGLANEMTFGGDLLPTFQFNNVISAAKDAIFIFDQFNVTRSSNTITDLMDGLEINLNGTTGGPATINIAVNMKNQADTIVGGVQALVNAYNDVIHAVDYVQSRKGLSESLYSWVRSSVINVMQQTVGNSSIDSIWNLGISGADPETRTNEEGIAYSTTGLTLDTTKLTEQLIKNYQAVNQFFTASGTGLIANVDNVIKGLNETSGPIETRKTSAESQEQVMERRIEKEEKRLEDMKKRMLIQYSKLNSLVQHYEQVAKYLESQMKSLDDMNKK